MDDSLHSSVVISIVRMSLAEKNLSDGQTQLLLRMGEGAWDPCDPKSRESIPELIATRWFCPSGYIKYFLYGVVPGVTLCSIEPKARSCKTRAMAVASLLQSAVHASTWIKAEESGTEKSAFREGQLTRLLVNEWRVKNNRKPLPACQKRQRQQQGGGNNNRPRTPRQ